MDIKRKPTKPWTLLILFFTSLIAMLYILFAFPPGFSYAVWNIHISYVIIFFVLLFLTIYSLIAFIFKRALQGILVALLVVVLLFFRLINLTHPFFTILLFVLFVCIEGVVWKRK